MLTVQQLKEIDAKYTRIYLEKEMLKHFITFTFIITRKYKERESGSNTLKLTGELSCPIGIADDATG